MIVQYTVVYVTLKALRSLVTPELRRSAHDGHLFLRGFAYTGFMARKYEIVVLE